MKEILFGMNWPTLLGFAVMAVALNMSRRRPRPNALLGIAIMLAGTALVAFGLYVGVVPN
jgi:hypothetical protein